MARYLTIEDGREYLWDFDENRILLVTYGDTENIRQVEFSTDDTEGPTTWTSEVMTNLTTGNKYVQVPNEFLNGEYSRLVCYVIAEDETGQHTRTKEIFRIKKRQQPEDYEITFTDRVYIRDLKAIAERYRDQAKSYSESAAASSTQAGQHNAEALASKNAAAESERNAGASMMSAQSAQHAAESARNDANAILTLVQSKGTEITNFVTTSKTELETQKNESLAEVRSVYTADLDELKSDLDDIRTIEVGQNLLDEANANLGYLESNGTISQSTSYKVSGYVELEANTDYCLTSYYNGTPFSNIRKIVMLYDSLKTPITSTYKNTKDGTSITFNSETYKYVRVCVEASRKSQLNKGTEKPYEPYKREVKNKMKIGSGTTFDENVIPGSAIIDLSVSKTEIINCYDESKAVVGFLNSAGGVDTSATNYKTSDYIRIHNGLSYTISPICRAYCLYDDNKMMLYYDSIEKKEPFTFFAENNGYLRFSLIGTTESNSIEVNTSFEGQPTIKNQEGIDLSNTQKKNVQDIAYNQNVLFGKKWVVVGDSFTNGDDSYDDHISEGIYKGKRALYHYLIGNRNLMDIVHFAEGGRVMTCPSDIQYHNSFSDVNSANNYTDIPSLNPDYITIWLGINDSKTESGEVPIGTITLGTIDDDTVNTFYGAWNVVLRYLITNCPYAHIGVIVSNGCTGTNFPNAIKEVCRKWGIAYLDLNGDYSVPLMHRVNGKSEVCEEAQNLRKSAFWVSDTNGHPNAHAQAYQSTFIENWLRSI